MGEGEIISLVQPHRAGEPQSLPYVGGACSVSTRTRLAVTCAFRTNVPADFTGDPQDRQLLTRGYARE